MGTRVRRIVLCLFASSCPWTLVLGAEDVLWLRDGSTQKGQVIELGGNKVELVLESGARKIPKKDISRASFDETRRLQEIETTDVVVKQGGQKIRGKVDLLDDGQKVQVTFPGGARAVLSRKDVVRILRRGEAVEHDSTVYTAELGESIRRALETLKAPAASREEPAAREAQAFLEDAGIFAIAAVRQELAKAEAGSPLEMALQRVDRIYRLKEIVADAIEEAEGHVYQILSGEDAIQKCDFLILVFPRYVEESVPLAAFLAKDPAEHATVRAWSVDFLRRMQRNSELLEIYRGSSGQVQLATAIALARNRIFLGMPTLIEALELESPEMRKLASKHIRELTGKDFQYRPDGAPHARKEAVARWRAWWQENEGIFREMAENVLRKNTGDTPERKAAVKLWKEATLALGEKKDGSASADLLRKAMLMDPTFAQAHISLAALLYGSGKPAEGIRVLEDLKARRTADLSTEERRWIYLHLGNAARLAGDLEKAASAYAQCRALAPESADAILGFADIAYSQATTGQALEPGAREERLKGALEAYEAAASILDKAGADLSTLRFEELPETFELPFNRREYNRSVLELRKNHRARRHEALFKVGKIRSLLGEKKEALLVLKAAADELGVDPTPESRKLEADMRTFIGILYEELGQKLLALKEFRKVLRDLDPAHEESRRAVERLRREAGPGN